MVYIELLNELLLKRKKKMRRQLTQEPETKDLTPGEKNRLLAERLLRELYDELRSRAEIAYGELVARKDELDPALLAMLEKYRRVANELKYSKWGILSGYLLTIIALRDAVEKGLHRKDKRELYSYIARYIYKFSKAAAREIPHDHRLTHRIEEITNPFKPLWDFKLMLLEAYEHGDKVDKEVWLNFYKTLNKIREEGQKSGVDFVNYAMDAHPYHTLAEALLEKYIPELKEEKKEEGEESSSSDGVSTGPAVRLYGLLKDWVVDAQEVKDELRSLGG